MSKNAIVEAKRLTQAVVEMLQRAAILSEGLKRSEIRYAEALARTLADQLALLREQEETAQGFALSAGRLDCEAPRTEAAL
jgi:hypothetical protein